MIFLFWFLGLVFIGLAIPLLRRKVGPNPLYGLRLKETFENEDVWYEANARSARDLVWIGIGTIVLSSALFFLPWRNPDDYWLLCFGLLIASVIWYCLRGFRIARAVKRELEGSSDR